MLRSSSRRSTFGEQADHELPHVLIRHLPATRGRRGSAFGMSRRTTSAGLSVLAYCACDRLERITGSLATSCFLQPLEQLAATLHRQKAAHLLNARSSLSRVGFKFGCEIVREFRLPGSRMKFVDRIVSHQLSASMC